MENILIFNLSKSTYLANKISNILSINTGDIIIRQFPDGETYLRVNSDVTGKKIIVVCDLHRPNHKILSLIFLLKTLKELGATHITLISPYLPYMRQDKRFKPGEAISSHLFASIISPYIDCLITVDPHLHRIPRLKSIYSIPRIKTLHAAPQIATWIKQYISDPFIIGPDSESEQWVRKVASAVDANYITLEKKRLGDRNVTITLPGHVPENKTIVFIDDIISTGTSILTALDQIKKYKRVICICVHALFKQSTHDMLTQSGVNEIVSTNTISHTTNKIDLSGMLADAIHDALCGGSA